MCYLTAVKEHDWPAAVTAHGYYPSVGTLMNSPYMVKGYLALLVEQTLGVYHMVTRFTAGATTLFLANQFWVVGAHLPHHPHPGHNAGYLQCPLAPSRPPLPPQSLMAPAVPLRVPTPKPRNRFKGKQQRGPFQPYSTMPQVRHPSSPTAKWKAVLIDLLDEAMESFQKELDIFLMSLAVPAWQDLQACLREMK